jgi:hypothetical protein
LGIYGGIWKIKMSISLQISGKHIPETEWESIPVATESIFEKYWLAIAKQLNLKYVPLFQIGIEIDLGTLDEVLKELCLIKSKMVNESMNNTSESVIERLDSLITRLPIYVKKYQVVFIG